MGGVRSLTNCSRHKQQSEHPKKKPWLSLATLVNAKISLLWHATEIDFVFCVFIFIWFLVKKSLRISLIRFSLTMLHPIILLVNKVNFWLVRLEMAFFCGSFCAPKEQNNTHPGTLLFPSLNDLRQTYLLEAQ